MNILHVSLTDCAGGADRAAYRIHSAQVRSGLRSKMLVLRKGTNDACVSQIAPRSIITQLRQRLSKIRQGIIETKWSSSQPGQYHFGQFGYGLVDEINSSNVDIVNLHWVADFLSIADIRKLRKPIVWTLHDMWPFCGGEHYVPDGEDARFRIGYKPGNRPDGESGPDLNRRTWRMKRRAWARQHFTIISPSRWLAECARQSLLFAESEVTQIPNAIDVEYEWKPLSGEAARTVLGLPLNKKLLLMGAPGGTSDPRKGGDLLCGAVKELFSHQLDDFELVIFGQGRPSSKDEWPCPVHWLGEVCDDRILAQAYSAADVLVVPSRQDNLPNVVLEALACGAPVVAFEVGGLPDIIEHHKTGYLAAPFDVSDLANGIAWTLASRERSAKLRDAARTSAACRFSDRKIAAAYQELYKRVLETRCP